MPDQSVSEDLNEVISAAVKAQVTAKVTEALAGGELFSKWIDDVLHRPVEVADPKGGYGRKKTVAWVDTILAKAIQGMTEDAVREALEEESPRIQDAVRKSVKRQAEQFAEDVTAAVMETAKDKYRIKVDIEVPRRRDEF